MKYSRGGCQDKLEVPAVYKGTRGGGHNPSTSIQVDILPRIVLRQVLMCVDDLVHILLEMHGTL